MASSPKLSLQSNMRSASSGPRQQSLKTYKRRYLVCFTFAFNRYFNVSQSAIDFFSLSFMIAYVPGSIICGLMFKKWYLRKSFIFSSGFQFIGSILRYIATLHFISTNSYWSHLPFIIAMIGQSMAALAQPFYTNSPARIPAEWFSKEGRDVATALLSIINPLGIGLGSFIPTMFVTDEGDHWYGFTGIMMLEVICCGVGFILTLLFFYDRPPTSPSMSQRLKKSNLSMKRSLRYDIGQILKNTEFVKLLFGFGIGLGLFNALTTLINQYTAAFGYTTDDAGNFGGILIGAGLLGAVVAGVAMEVFRDYRSILKVFTTLTVIALFCLLWYLQPDHLVLVTVLFGVFGFLAIPIVAVTFETAAECTYPVNEEVSSALLMTSGSMFGITYVSVWGAQLPAAGEHYSSRWNFSSYFLIGNGLLMLVAMLWFGGEYKRLKAEHEYTKLIEDLNEEDLSVIESDFAPSPRRPINQYGPPLTGDVSEKNGHYHPPSLNRLDENGAPDRRRL